MNKLISEEEAYAEYVKAYHSKIGEFVSELNFLEWRASGRPKTQYPKDGNWPTPWPNGKAGCGENACTFPKCSCD